MNPEIKALWLDALRSGNYTQGKEYLKTLDGSYCCLGVLCDLAVKAGVIPEPGDPLYEVAAVTYGEDDPNDFDGTSDIDLPNAVREWAGLDSNSPAVPCLPGDPPQAWANTRISLAELNDEGKTFEDIAQRIEDNL